jgi:hypothetical protein
MGASSFLHRTMSVSARAVALHVATSAVASMRKNRTDFMRRYHIPHALSSAQAVLNTGDLTTGERTAQNDVWI